MDKIFQFVFSTAIGTVALLFLTLIMSAAISFTVFDTTALSIWWDNIGIITRVCLSVSTIVALFSLVERD